VTHLCRLCEFFRPDQVDPAGFVFESHLSALKRAFPQIFG